MKKSLPWVLALFLLLVCAACGGKTDDAVIDCGTSERYTAEEIEAAAAVVEQEFKTLEGCELHALTYAGDERSQQELDYYNSLDEGTVYADCIVFDSSFRSPKKGGGAWEADTEYTWSWILTREEGGDWTLLTYGYG